MIINAEDDWSLIEANKIRKKNTLNIILKATEKNNELETDNVLDSTSAPFRVQFKAVWLLASSTDCTKQGH